MTIQTGGVEHLTRTQRRICFLVVYRLSSVHILCSAAFPLQPRRSAIVSLALLNCPQRSFRLHFAWRQQNATPSARCGSSWWKGARTDTPKHPHQHSWANTRRYASSIHTVLIFGLGVRNLVFFLPKNVHLRGSCFLQMCVCPGQKVFFLEHAKADVECEVFFCLFWTCRSAWQCQSACASRGGEGAVTEAVFDRKRSQPGEHCWHWIPGQRSLEHSRVRRTAFEVPLLGVFPARGFDGHHAVRTSGGMFCMWGLASRARTVRSVRRSRAHASIGQRCLAASICWCATSSLVRHRILARPSSLTNVCSNRAADPSHHVVSLSRFSRTRRIFWPTCPTLFALPNPLCMGLLSPHSVVQWNTSAQMPLQVSQVCREIRSPWPLKLWIYGDSRPFNCWRLFSYPPVQSSEPINWINLPDQLTYQRTCQPNNQPTHQPSAGHRPDL